MKGDTKQGKLDRRSFFKKAGAAAGVAGAAAATVARGAKAETATDRAKTGGYRETEHVRTYYDLAKF